MKKNNRFEVECGKGEWERVTNGQEVRQGFLHYELKDGTIGLARPGTWRMFVPIAGQPVRVPKTLRVT